MVAAAAARGLTVRHYLQSNLIGYGNHWDPVIRTMFGGSVGTSMDVPNDHRRLKNGSTERYTDVWLASVARARAAGLHVSAIAVVHAGTLRAGAHQFLRFFAEQAHIDDVQVNLPFPGGPGRGGDTLAADIENGDWPLPGQQFGAVVVTHYLWRPLWPQILGAVQPGGVLLYETFAQGNETVGRPARPEFLLQPGELLKVAAEGGLRVIAYEDGFLDSPDRFVQRMAAVREHPSPTPARWSLR